KHSRTDGARHARARRASQPPPLTRRFAPPSPRRAGRGNYTGPMIRTSTAGSVTTITLDRPEKLNAFSGTMREDLLAALREAEGHVVVITGAGRAFCGGGDVEFMSLLQKLDDTERFRSLLDAGRDVVMQIATMAKPVIAAVNGAAAGAGGTTHI